MDLRGKTALVTGAARRVGRAIAEELAGAGARVVVHHHASAAEAAEVAFELGGAVAIQADLRQAGAAAQLVEAARQATGRLDVLVNSAAAYARAPLEQLEDAAWESMLSLNLTAPLRLTREAVRSGAVSIVNVVDVAAWQPWANWSAYAVSKAGLLHLTRCLALELAPRVRVNAVAPGTVAFPEDWDEARRLRHVGKIPLGHSGAPDDVARAVRYLVEEEFLTGVCLPVDGGSGLR